MKKLMIVEDEDILRNAYASIFTMEKFQVVQASNGKEALENLEKEHPDIIILDVLMPVMSGIDFLEQAQVRTNYPDVKILVLSNLSDSETITNVMKLGAKKHLIKSSLSPNELVKAVKSL